MQQQLRLTLDESIMPSEGLGGLRLRTHITALDDLLERVYIGKLTGDRWYELVNLYEARYDLGAVQVGVDVRNGKIFKLTASEGYNGLLFGKIWVGMSVTEAMAAEPLLYYDEVEEGLYVRDCPGVVLDIAEIDPRPDEVASYPIVGISVFAPEIWETTATNITW
jgi:hypothetical protein